MIGASGLDARREYHGSCVILLRGARHRCSEPVRTAEQRSWVADGLTLHPSQWLALVAIEQCEALSDDSLL
jgi:hypothetical protein